MVASDLAQVKLGSCLPGQNIPCAFYSPQPIDAGQKVMIYPKGWRQLSPQRQPTSGRKPHACGEELIAGKLKREIDNVGAYSGQSPSPSLTPV